jgi:hypothetical protein
MYSIQKIRYFTGNSIRTLPSVLKFWAATFILPDTLGESPNTMMFGREVLMPVDLLFGKTSQLKDVSTPEYVHNLTNRMDKVHDIVRDRLIKTSRPNIMVLGDSPKVSCSDDL